MLRLLLPLILVFCAFFVGCGKPQTLVHGTVSWKGKPVEEGTIEFCPTRDKTLPITVAEVKNGQYSIKAPRGEMLVRVAKHEHTRDDVLVGPTGEKTVIPVITNVIPPKFNDRSEIKIILEGKEKQYDFSEK